MRGITAIVITLNEEKNIGRCLESLKFADAIVVMDSFSTDATVEIARRYTPHVFQRKWEGYSQQRAAALERVQTPWVLWLDADEEATAELAEEIKRLDEKAAEGWKINRRVRYLGRWIDGCGWYPDHNLRLFKKDLARFSFRINNNDTVDIDGRIGRLENPINHYPYRDLAHHIGKLNHYTSMLADQMRREGQSSGMARAVAHALFKLFKMYVLQRGFLLGAQGLVVCLTGAFYVFLKYAKLWELGLAPENRDDEPR